MVNGEWCWLLAFGFWLLAFTLRLSPFLLRLAWTLALPIFRPSPFTLHLSCCGSRGRSPSQSFTFHLSPFTLHHSPFTLHPSPFTFHLSPSLLICFIFLLAAGCATLPERADICSIRDFYLHGVRDPECAVATETGIAGEPHRIFRIASLGKLFVHLVFLRMEREGRLDLDRSVRSVSKFDLPPEYGAVTLRDLLENRSGLPREFLNPWNPLDWHTALMCGLVGSHIYAGFESRAAFAEELSGRRARAAVRERVPRYSNMGFALLVLCVEDLTGRTIDEMLHDELVAPLGLEDTSLCPVGEAIDRLTPPCSGKLPWLYRRGAVVPEHRLGPALRGMGSVFSSAADCAKVFRAYWEVVDHSLTGRPLADCGDDENLGLLKVRTLAGGRRILYRFGMIYGGGSFVAFDPSSRRFLVILRNVTSWPAAEDFDLSSRFFARKGR